jgi:hypothetical protein
MSGGRTPNARQVAYAATGRAFDIELWDYFGGIRMPPSTRIVSAFM